MPSKHSTMPKRPPSPYSFSQTPRTASTRRTPRPFYGSNNYGHVDKAINEHANGKWGISSSQRMGHEKPGMPYKSQEDMYDEILALKKASVIQKNDFDVLKAKTRRLEEENTRKEKYIQQLLNPTNNDESIRSLAEGKMTSRNSVIANLKQHQMKLEKQLRDKEIELTILKSDLKTTDITEMKTAMEIYYQEVLRLRDVVSSHEYNSKRSYSAMTNDSEIVPGKVKAMRKKVLQLTAENNKLIEENRSLKRDLDNMLNGEIRSMNGDDGDDIKYSALNRTELVSTIREAKESEKHKYQVLLSESQNKEERFKKVIDNLKGERNELRSENENLQSENSKLQRKIAKQVDANEELHMQLKRAEKTALDNRQIEKEQKEISRMKRKNFEENRAARSIQRQWRQHREANKFKKEDDVVLLQSAFRGHMSRQQYADNFSHEEETDDVSSRDVSDEDEVILLQSAIRGHMERKKVKESRRKSSYNSKKDEYENSDSDDDVVMMSSIP